MFDSLEKDKFQSINVNDLGKNIEIITLIDIREPSEFTTGHIPKAKNIPMKELIAEAENHLDKAKEYHIVCQSGKRSSRVCKFLSSQGFNVINVDGGTMGYKGSIDK